MNALLVADRRGRRSGTLGSEAGQATESDIEMHVAGCERCARAVEIVHSAEGGLAAALVASTTQLTPESIAAFAYRRVRRERLVKWTVLPAIALLFAAATVFLANKFGSELKEFFAPPPAVETQTFSLTCLSGEQAARVLRPYLPRPKNPMWQAERFDVRPAGGGIRAVTVSAPKSTLAQVPAILERFERDVHAACRAQTRN